jgi:NADP-dependent 3-hydroxy acid dehydrogenase YdfG
MNEFKKTIIITGATRGIGRQIALDFALSNNHLILIARNRAELSTLKDEIEKSACSCDIYVGSLSDYDFIKSTWISILQNHSKIDMLINNAGIGIFKQFEDLAFHEIEQVIDTNIKGSIFLTQMIVKQMKVNQSGHIINVISDVGKRTVENGSIYCASKYAQEALFSTLRKEVRPYKIKVSNVYSGLVDTYFHSVEQGNTKQTDFLKVKDISNSVLFIANQPENVVIDELMIHPLFQEY